MALIASVVFLLAYVVIISEKVHRTVIAISGAVLMILLGVLTQEQAIEGVDFNTLGLLIGMMVVVGIAKQSGMFQAVAIIAAKVGKGDPRRIFLFLGLITMVFSAFLDNVTTVFLMVPVTFVIANNLGINPKPFLFATIILSNVGGAATLIGDPPNIIIGSAAQLSFNDFLQNMLPISFIIAFFTVVALLFWYRKDLKATDEAKISIMQFDPKKAISDWPLLIRSLVVFSFIFLGFFTHTITHIEVATIAFAGAALLLLLTLNDPEVHLQEVEWTTIFFFVGLFILVSGIEHVGIIHLIAEKFLQVTDGNLAGTALLILWGSAIASAIVDNIPFVAIMIPLIQDVGALSHIPLAPLWWALAMGADFGGNATIVGASANVVVKGMAEKAGYKIGFIEYMKTALPLTVLALILCTIYIWVRYL